MATNSLDPNAAAGRLREMLGGLSAAYPPDPQPARPPDPQPAPSPAVIQPAPNPVVVQPAAATQVVEPWPVKPQMTPAPKRPAPQMAASGEKMMESEKTHVLEGFYHWVTAKVTSVQPDGSDGALSDQVVREIAGVAGFVSVLLVQAQDE